MSVSSSGEIDCLFSLTSWCWHEEMFLFYSLTYPSYSSPCPVGYFNYRYFVNFLFYIFVAMAYGAIITLEPFLLLSSRDYKEQIRHAIKQQQGTYIRERSQPMLPFRDEKMLLTLSFMLCMAVGVAVLLLGGFHLYLTLTAQTTIEFHANFAHRKRAKKAGQKWRNPYSLGTARSNWQQVYGSQHHPLVALLPSAREPELLPVPIPGYLGRNKADKIESSTSAENVGLGEAIV